MKRLLSPVAIASHFQMMHNPPPTLPSRRVHSPPNNVKSTDPANRDRRSNTATSPPLFRADPADAAGLAGPRQQHAAPAQHLQGGAIPPPFDPAACCRRRARRGLHERSRRRRRLKRLQHVGGGYGGEERAGDGDGVVAAPPSWREEGVRMVGEGHEGLLRNSHCLCRYELVRDPDDGGNGSRATSGTATATTVASAASATDATAEAAAAESGHHSGGDSSRRQRPPFLRGGRHLGWLHRGSISRRHPGDPRPPQEVDRGTVLRRVASAQAGAAPRRDAHVVRGGRSVRGRAGGLRVGVMHGGPGPEQELTSKLLTVYFLFFAKWGGGVVVQAAVANSQSLGVGGGCV